jgi:ribosomal protein S8
MIDTLNINSAQKRVFAILPGSRKILALSTILYKIGVFQYLRMFKKRIICPLLQVHLSYYKKHPLTKNLKLISRPNRSFYISANALRILNKRTRASTYVISTSLGIVTDKLALYEHSGGLVVCFFLN